MDQLQSDLIAKGYTTATNNKTTNILKRMFKKAVEWEMVEAETLKRVREVKPLKGEGKRLRYLSRDECMTLLSKCKGDTRAIVLTALNTGMRRGEILGLRWNQVDLKHGFILLEMTKNGDRREIPINETLRSMLEALPTRFIGGFIFGKIIKFDNINDKTGERSEAKTVIPYRDLRKGFRTACDEARIQDFHFHDLRHTFASHLVMAGVDITTVSRLLGHKSLTIVSVGKKEP